MRRGAVGIGSDHGAPDEDVGRRWGAVEEAAGVVEIAARGESCECDEAAQWEDLAGNAGDGEVGVDLRELFHGSAEVEQRESWVFEFEDCCGLGIGIGSVKGWGSWREEGEGGLRLHFHL